MLEGAAVDLMESAMKSEVKLKLVLIGWVEPCSPFPSLAVETRDKFINWLVLSYF